MFRLKTFKNSAIVWKLFSEGRVTEGRRLRERERNLPSCGLLSRGPQWQELSLSETKSQEFLSSIPYVCRNPTIWASPTAFPGNKQGARLEMEQPQPLLVTMWDASAIGRNLVYCINWPHSYNEKKLFCVSHGVFDHFTLLVITVKYC